MKSSRLIFIFSYISLTFILFNSCNIDKNRKLLSVFFDGVPEKKIEKKENLEEPKEIIKRRRITEPFISFHPDYKSRKCSQCHTRRVSNFLKTDRKKICFTCHKEEKFTGPCVHGPVAVRACNICHHPHQAKNQKLLLEKGRKLCDQCHRIPMTNEPLPCKGDDCLECHDPHISDNKFFLKNINRKNTNEHGKENGEESNFN